jgi:hypothetical protein
MDLMQCKGLLHTISLKPQNISRELGDYLLPFDPAEANPVMDFCRLHSKVHHLKSTRILSLSLSLSLSLCASSSLVKPTSY